MTPALQIGAIGAALVGVAAGAGRFISELVPASPSDVAPNASNTSPQDAALQDVAEQLQSLLKQHGVTGASALTISDDGFGGVEVVEPKELTAAVQSMIDEHPEWLTAFQRAAREQAAWSSPGETKRLSLTVQLGEAGSRFDASV